MKQKIIGIYIGREQCQLVLREGTGGEFWVTPEKGSLPRIKVGAGEVGGTWKSVVDVLLHEALELQLYRLGCRFEPSDDMGRDHATYLFVLNHCQFSDAVARTGLLLAQCLPDLAREWRRWNRPAKKRKRPCKKKHA